MQKLSIFVLSIVATGALFWSSAQAQQAPAPGAQNPPAKASSQAPAKGPWTSKSGQASSSHTPAALTLNTPKDKLSYSIGMNIAKSLKRDDVDVDTAVLLRAIQDVLGGGNLLMTDQEAQSILTNLQADLRKKQEQGMQQAAETDRKSTRLNSSHVAISYAVFC